MRSPLEDYVPWSPSSYEAQTAVVSSLFRYASVLVLTPVALLILLDILSYLYFRVVHQPFGRARTMVYKQWPALSRPSSTANTPAPGSPTAPRSPSTESPPALRKIRHIFPSFSTKRNPNVLVSRTDSAYPDLHGPVTASPLISPPTSSGASTHIVSSREISSSEDEPQKPSDQPNRGRRVQYEDLKLPLPKRDSPSRDRAGSVGVEGPMGFFESGSPLTSPEMQIKPLPSVDPSDA